MGASMAETVTPLGRGGLPKGLVGSKRLPPYVLQVLHVAPYFYVFADVIEKEQGVLYVLTQCSQAAGRMFRRFSHLYPNVYREVLEISYFYEYITII